MFQIRYLLSCLALSLAPFLIAQNHALDFDGLDDYVIRDNALAFSLGGDFTVHLEFRYDGPQPATACGTGDHTLFALRSSAASSQPGFFDVRVCNNGLEYLLDDGSTTYSGPLTLPAGFNLYGQWHSISARQSSGGGVELYVNCIPAGTIPNSIVLYEEFRLGATDISSGANQAKHFFDGRIDNVQLWNVRLSSSDLCDLNDCPVDLPNDLALLYPLDQGIANGNNSSISDAIDATQNNENGKLVNFGLTGSTSNFVPSGSPILYPTFNNVELRITDIPTRTNPITQICSGDPVHLALYQNGLPIPPNPAVNVSWEILTSGSWSPLSSAIFSGFAFGVPPGALVIDCQNSLTGFDDTQIRAVIDVGGQCSYTTDRAPLRICCEPDVATVNVTTGSGNTTLCEGDTESFSVSLTSTYNWIANPPSNVSIVWDTNGTVIPAFDDLTSFNVTVPWVSFPGMSFTATIMLSPCGKTGQFTSSIPVDQKPVCGTIIGLPQPSNLMLVSQSPLIYEICPGEDAALGEDMPFMFCTPVWQYSFVPNSTNPADWTDMGSSNTIQNTNILPGTYWQAGATEVYYRVECRPLGSPSACDPCYSNTLTIRLKQPPIAGSISGPTSACIGDNVPLTLTGATGGTITWLHNGKPVQTGGATYTATESGCYRVEVDNGCEIVTTVKHCIAFCGPTAVISCPLDPNACAQLPDPIDLSGCGSIEGCSGGPLTYTWTWDSGTLVTVNGCDLKHIPDASGTTYTLVVTDANGCMDSSSRRVVPCP